MPTIALVSVNCGTLERRAPGAARRTAIRKQPVGGPVLCDAHGLVGDVVGNRTHHGGPDQAVYLYSAEDYAWWAAELGRPCTPGLFGENLTIDAWWDAPRVGDRVQCGEVLLELTAPRIPCATLAARMGDPQFVARFTRAARCGAYARVLQGGALAAGMPGDVRPGDSGWPTITELFALWHRTPRDRRALLDALRAPVSARLRVTLLERASRADPSRR